MRKDLQPIPHAELFESQLGIVVSEVIEKGLAGCTVYRGLNAEQKPVVVKIGTSERGQLEISDNVHGYQNIEALGAGALIPSPITQVDTDFGPALIMPDLGSDFLATSVDPASTKANFDALTLTLDKVYESVAIKSPEAARQSLQNILEKLSLRISMFPEKFAKEIAAQYASYIDLSEIDIDAIAGETSSLFILDFTPSNVFIVGKEAKFIDPWKQTTYLGAPLLSLAQFITYAEEAYEVPGFNAENLNYLDFVMHTGRKLGLNDDQIRLQFKLGQALQYSLSAYYRMEKQPETAKRFLAKMASNIDDLRSYHPNNLAETTIDKPSNTFLLDNRDPEFWINDFPQLVELYKDTFKDAPWHLELTTEYVQDRLRSHFSQESCNIIVFVHEGKIVGATWYDQPTLEDLAQMRGDEIARYVQENLDAKGIKDYVWMRETIVHPQMQRQGIGRKLREEVLSHIENSYPAGVFVLTRHREDNAGILKLSHENGYSRTGVRQLQKLNGVMVENEFWYKLIQPQTNAAS